MGENNKKKIVVTHKSIRRCEKFLRDVFVNRLEIGVSHIILCKFVTVYQNKIYVYTHTQCQEMRKQFICKHPYDKLRYILDDFSSPVRFNLLKASSIAKILLRIKCEKILKIFIADAAYISTLKHTRNLIFRFLPYES